MNTKIKLWMRLWLLCFASTFAYCSQVDLSRFSSYEELVQFEQTQIATTPAEKPAELSDACLNLGETYLLQKEYELALAKLSDGLEIAQECPNLEQKNDLIMRSLFGLAMSYAGLDRTSDFLSTVDALQGYIKSCYCNTISDTKSTHPFFDQKAHYSSRKSDVPILGPDHISIGDCVKRVENTAELARDLIVFVTRKETAFILLNLINGLESNACQCCRNGGLWKACIQPLANKWHLWNQKWKLFGIPPDPAWD